METTSCDILLTGGRVIDPANGISRKADVAIQDGRILLVGDGSHLTPSKALDVSGCYVTPGLIDMHCHCYPTFPFASDSLPTLHPDAHMFQNGVTTAVDAGTCGWQDFPRFQEEVIQKAQVRVLAFLNIADKGMVHMTGEDDPSTFHPALTAEVAKAFPEIVGIKTAHYWVHKPFDHLHTPWASVDAMVEAGELSGKPCMADFQPTLPDRTYPELLLTHLRPGDIHTHMYAQQFPVLDSQGKVSDFLFNARQRGILFDLGHGAGSFWLRNAVPALAQGFPPDTISTDLYLDNVAGPVIGLLHVMSKYLSMGMPLEEIIRRVTVNPAAALRRPELGTLTPAAWGDVAVIRVVEGAVGFGDSGRAKMTGSRRLECLLTLRKGCIVYDPYALSLPNWETAPAPYWTSPGVLP